MPMAERAVEVPATTAMIYVTGLVAVWITNVSSARTVPVPVGVPVEREQVEMSLHRTPCVILSRHGLQYVIPGAIARSIKSSSPPHFTQRGSGTNGCLPCLQSHPLFHEHRAGA